MDGTGGGVGWVVIDGVVAVVEGGGAAVGFVVGTGGHGAGH